MTIAEAVDMTKTIATVLRVPVSVESMGYKCIAPGCNSGYDNNPGSFHFFLVPKDPAIIMAKGYLKRRYCFEV